MKCLLRAITAVSLGLAFATVTFAQVMPGSVPGPSTSGAPPALSVPPPPPADQMPGSVPGPTTPGAPPAPTMPPPPPTDQMTKDTGKVQTPQSEKKHKRKKHTRTPKPVQP
jgi:hypothetical protein